MAEQTDESQSLPLENAAPEFTRVAIEELQVGRRLRMPIQGNHGVLILAQNQVVTESFLSNLRNRGITHVQIHKSEAVWLCVDRPQRFSQEIPPGHPSLASDERNSVTDQLDVALDNPENLRLPPQEEVYSESIARHRAEPFDEKRKEEFLKRQTHAIQPVDHVFNHLLRGDGLDLDGLSTIADEALTDLQDDMDLFATLGVNPFGGNFPARHSMHTCMLAISIGTQLQLDRPTLKELAIGCLIHDAGMLMIDSRIHNQPRRIGGIDFLEITKHPIRIFDRMLDMRGIPVRSAYVAYQMHERPNGTGYPRQRKDSQIHFLSKVAAVADVFVALVSPRPYREAILPFTAMSAIVKAGSEGQFDLAAVTALRRTLSAYPLGSYVQLDDGRVATVIRSNDVAFESPVIEAWKRDALGETSEVVDLSQEKALRIVGPIPALTAHYQSEFSEKLAIKRVIETLEAKEKTAGFASRRQHVRRVFQTPVSVYVPHKESWRCLRATSRNISSGGRALLLKEGISNNAVVVSFDLQANLRASFQAEILRRQRIDDDWWDFGIRFVKQVTEPAEVEQFGRL